MRIAGRHMTVPQRKVRISIVKIKLIMLMALKKDVKYVLMLLSLFSVSVCVEEGFASVNLGVLAKLGKEDCFNQWQATATYLEEVIGEKIVLQCLSFEELPVAVLEKRVDFTITNPSMYVTLEHDYGATRIATLKNKRASKSVTQFGGVIFHRKDRDDLNTIEDLKGQRFMAVDEQSFGGWQVSWKYLLEHDIDPYVDFRELTFGGQHDAVVFAVKNGVVDAGAVRTDTLERLARVGTIDMSEFEVFNGSAFQNKDFPFVSTTRLYPEWPFAVMRSTSEELAKRVSMALLEMKPESDAAIQGRVNGWTIPLDYYLVHECLKFLKQGPYGRHGEVTLRQLYRQYRDWIVGGVVLIGFLLAGAGYVLLLNRRIKTAFVRLDKEYEERKQVNAELNEFKRTLDQTHDCVFMFAPYSLRFLYANQGGIQHIGYNLEELLRMKPFDITPEFTKEKFLELATPLLHDPLKSITYVTKHQTKSGALVPVEIFLQYVVSTEDDGRFVAIVRDITDRLREQKEKEQLQVNLVNEQKMASVGQMAAGIAHEINTPTQYIGTNIEFLHNSFTDVSALINQHKNMLEKAIANDVLQDEVIAVQEMYAEVDWDYLEEEIPLAIQQSLDGIKQISSIVLAMKDFSHPGSEKMEVVDVNQLIKTVVTVARNEWKSIATVQLDLTDQKSSVPCRPNEVNQVLLNLLVNAAYAIGDRIHEKGSFQIGTIDIQTISAGDYLEIRVHDTGAGIPADIIQKIFDPFFTTKEVGKGTGQGLAIAYDIITNKHYGRLEVESKKDLGTTFIIYLPFEHEGRTTLSKSES